MVVVISNPIRPPMCLSNSWFTYFPVPLWCKCNYCIKFVVVITNPYCVPYWWKHSCLYNRFSPHLTPSGPLRSCIIVRISNPIWTSVHLTDACIHSFVFCSHPIWLPQDICNPVKWPTVYLTDASIHIFITVSHPIWPPKGLWSLV